MKHLSTSSQLIRVCLGTSIPVLLLMGCLSITYVYGYTADIMLLIFVIITILLYKFLRVKNWLFVGIFTIFTAIIVMRSGVLLNSNALVFIPLILFFSLITACIFWVVFNAIHLNTIMKLVIAAIISGAITGIVLKGVPMILFQWDNINQHKQEKKDIKSYNFTVYTPDYVPNGYSLFSAEDYREGPDNPPYFLVVYASDNKNKSPQIGVTIFKLPTSYSPPNACGYNRPPSSSDDISGKCHQIGQSNQGNPIYLSDSTGLEKDYFTAINGSKVFIVPYSSDNHSLDVSSDEIIKMFNSLQPKTTSQLMNLVSKYRPN